MSRAPRPVHMTANAADNEYEIWERLLQQWEIARGLPCSSGRIRGEMTIIHDLTCVAVKKQRTSLRLYSKCIHQFIDRMLSSEVKGLQKNYTVLCRLQCMWTQQLNNQLALKDVLPILWKITINYIVSLLSTEYDVDEKGSLIELLHLFVTNCEDQIVRNVALTLHCMIQQPEGLINIESSDTILYLRGTQLFHSGEWNFAITIVHSCTKSSNILISSAADLLIGCCHAKQGRYQMALSTMQKVIKDEERLLVYALYNLVQVFIGLSNPDGGMAADELLHQALNYKEDAPKASICQWNAFWSPVTQDDKSPLSIRNRSIPFPPELGDLAIQTYHYACRAYHNKRFEVTVKLLTTLVDNTQLPLESDHLPTRTQLVVDLCHALVCAGCYHEAISRCDALLELLPTQSIPHCVYSILLNHSSSNEILMIQARLLLCKGEALQQIGDHHKALPQYRSALQKLSVVERSSVQVSSYLTVQLLNNLSLILIGLNRNSEALSLLNEAIERDTRNKASIYNHTLLLWKMGNVNKAIEGWAWFRELAIATHEQCQRTLQHLNESNVPQDLLDQWCLLMDKSVLLHTLRQF